MHKLLWPQRRAILLLIIISIIVSGIIIIIIVLTPLIRPPISQLLVDRNGVTKIYETKGEEYYGFEYKYDSRLERDEFYLEDVAVLDGEYTAYIKLDTREDEKEEEVSFKLRGGKHNDDHRLAGRCYAIGVQFNGEPHLAKEYPEHPKTPKFQNEINIADDADRNIGDLNGRWVGLKVVIYNNKDDSVEIEVYVDNKGLLANDNPANDWKLWWTSTDGGDWRNEDGKEEGGEPYSELQGENGGTDEMVYIRIDQIEEEGKTQIKYESVREIDSSNRLKKTVNS